eukprot:3207462-Amphidinium_carterae.1
MVRSTEVTTTPMDVDDQNPVEHTMAPGPLPTGIDPITGRPNPTFYPGHHWSTTPTVNQDLATMTQYPPLLEMYETKWRSSCGTV